MEEGDLMGEEEACVRRGRRNRMCREWQVCLDTEQRASAGESAARNSGGFGLCCKAVALTKCVARWHH